MRDYPDFTIQSTFAIPRGTVFFAPEVELRRIIAPNGDIIREEFIWHKQGAAVVLNVADGTTRDGASGHTRETMPGAQAVPNSQPESDGTSATAPRG